MFFKNDRYEKFAKVTNFIDHFSENLEDSFDDLGLQDQFILNQIIIWKVYWSADFDLNVHNEYPVWRPVKRFYFAYEYTWTSDGQTSTTSSS